MYNYRKMRRVKQEISRQECIEVLKNAPRGILSMHGENGFPYSVPINQYYDEENGKLGIGIEGREADQKGQVHHHIIVIENLIVSDHRLISLIEGILFFLAQSIILLTGDGHLIILLTEHRTVRRRSRHAGT